MKLRRPVYLAGGAHTPFIGKFHPDFIWKGHPDFGKRENPTLEQLIGRAVRGAFEDTSVSGADIERGYVGNFTGELFSNQGHLGSMLARVDEGLEGKPLARLEGACASGGLALVSGIDAIQAGVDVVLVVGAEVQTTYKAVEGADFLARAAHYAEERELDPFTFPCMFARRTKAYMEAFGLTEDELAEVVVKAYSNANRNPYAHMQAFEMTRQHASEASDRNPKFLSNEKYKDYLKVSDCSQVSDGASAVILVSEQGLEKIGGDRDRVTEALSYGVSTGPLGRVEDHTFFTNSHRAAIEAYKDGGIGPNDLGVVEVHDCFSICELLMTEAIGLAERGEGIELVKQGITRLDGNVPVNSGGGLLAFGHPVGATGVKQALEIHRQIHGLCGDYQISEPPVCGLAANMGGDDRTAVVTAWRKT